VLDVLVFEPFGDRRAQPSGDDPFDSGVDVERGADDRARKERRAVLLFGPFVALRRERQFGGRDVHRLFRGPQRCDHHAAGGQQDEEVGRDVLVEGAHEHRGVARAVGDRIGVEAGDGYADEVHQVVAGEGQRQGEGSREDRDAQDVDPEALDHVEQNRTGRPADQHGGGQMPVHRLDEVVAREHGLEPLEDGEVDDRRERGAAPDGPVAAEERRVAEREDHARDVHDDRAAGEGDDHRQQDGRHDAHGARGVDVLPERGDALRGVSGDLVDRHGDGRTQQTEDERHGGRGRQPPRVVEVQQDDVGEHDPQVEHHHFVEGEESRVEHAVAGDLHHTARGDDADEDARGGDQQDDAHRSGLGADGRVEKVYRVVGDADEETGYGENSQNADNDGVDFAHAWVRANCEQIYREKADETVSYSIVNVNLTLRRTEAAFRTFCRRAERKKNSGRSQQFPAP